MPSNKTILITGGTGSFGNAFVPMSLGKYDPKKIIILYRDEMKQWEMAKLLNNDGRVRFFIGYVRDKDRLYPALDEVDFVVHAAVTKIAPTAEYKPFECVKTNINGAMNLIDAYIEQVFTRVVALPTKKAISPINLCGKTKLLADKFLLSGNAFYGENGSPTPEIKYGNVMSSSSLDIPFFMSIKDKGVIQITDYRMTRFMQSLEEAVKLIRHTF